ncbi:pyridoxal-phosphate-dependent aminotransferase family protein [Pelolinea submarina]|uniref:L-aspartate aminotransferase /phosphoserine aminotransferase n=1 Tax=Pelolinea submarina TaxID=913107 RepID=A0A347ZU27_9CHLR|nr:alanine--glyoxylate aminotransferase family protein [Pelolinea submarina]REG10608.1 L-aspartate aminotransferase /phosphoserine aminotransferase [Pelolinea submarina]BBB48808.1 alanine-glyoxylate transaminase /serine-glyoxylate transaminase /serine-pyruvate transaminase [Pelolinea submarina]
MEQAQMKLMIPGPVEVDPKVLAALSEPVEPHYGDAWVKKYARVIDILRQIFNVAGKNYDVYLMVGSGTCAIDASMSSSLMRGEKIIIGNNGFFGGRLIEVAKNAGLNIVEVPGEWGKPLDPQAIKKALDANPDAKAVSVVHGETSTTVLNPVKEIGAIVAASEAIFLVDAVSSFGGIPFDMEDWNVDICASATQKCLGALPGLAPVSVSQKGWKTIDRSFDKGHSWYTNLQNWRKYGTEWADWHPTPVTMPTNNVNALLVALEQLMEEGIENRIQRYRSLALRLRKGLREAGMEPYTSDEMLNPVLTAAYAPEGHKSGEIIQYLLNEHHIQIGGGLGHLKDVVFRIGHMSPVVTEADIDRVVDALKAF